MAQEQERIPPVNYTGTFPCDCCGSWMDCDKCLDPKVAELMHHTLWYTNGSPMAHHLHLCDVCKAAGCNFTEPNGEGEHCGDAEYAEDCDCIVDAEDGSTIQACDLPWGRLFRLPAVFGFRTAAPLCR